MVVAMAVVGVVQVAACPIVDMAAVGDHSMSAARAMLVRHGMDTAFMPRRAFLRVAVRDEEDVVVHVVAVLVVEMAVVQVVLVAVVQDLVVAAAVRVMVGMPGVLLAGFHGKIPQGIVVPR